MKKGLLLLIIFSLGASLVLVRCKEVDTAVDVPSCIERKIRKIKREDVRNPPAKVWKWEDAGQIYYYITSDCCDQFNYLHDKNCDIVCAPDGGFTGGGDGTCPDFGEDLKTTLVWEDDRR